MQGAKLGAIRALFQALFDTVALADDFDEQRWQDLIAALNATGRLVFGWPHLESSESDIFGALDDIADQLSHTKADIERTTADARLILGELRDAIGMGDPEAPAPPSLADHGESSGAPIPAEPVKPTPVESAIIEPEYSAPDLTEPEPAVAVPSPTEEEPSRDQREPETAVAAPQPVKAPDKRHQNGRVRLTPADRQAMREGRAAGRPLRELAEQFGVDVSRVSQLTNDIEVERYRRDETPRYDVEAMFASIRRTDSLIDAAMDLGIKSATLSGRLDVLQGHGKLPDDILAKRPRRAQEDAAKAAAPADPPAGETFEERRKRMAHEASERTWRAAHPEAAQA